ncbi:hypothetical protein BJX70DRAFT_131490 [Aspergillus crustosus]
MMSRGRLLHFGFLQFKISERSIKSQREPQRRWRQLISSDFQAEAPPRSISSAGEQKVGQILGSGLVGQSLSQYVLIFVKFFHDVLVFQKSAEAQPLTAIDQCGIGSEDPWTRFDHSDKSDIPGEGQLKFE